MASGSGLGMVSFSGVMGLASSLCGQWFQVCVQYRSFRWTVGVRVCASRLDWGAWEVLYLSVGASCVVLEWTTEASIGVWCVVRCQQVVTACLGRVVSEWLERLLHNLVVWEFLCFCGGL